MSKLVVAIKNGLAAHTCVTFFRIMLECRQCITSPKSFLRLTWDIHFCSTTVASPSERLHNITVLPDCVSLPYIADTETNHIVFISHIGHQFHKDILTAMS